MSICFVIGYEISMGYHVPWHPSDPRPSQGRCDDELSQGEGHLRRKVEPVPGARKGHRHSTFTDIQRHSIIVLYPRINNKNNDNNK